MAEPLDDADFLSAVETGRWPLGDWNHRAHVRTAWLYLRRLPLDAALDAIRNTIQRYNALQGVPDGPERGYHETITQAFMRLLHGRLASQPSAGFDEFCDQNPDLLDRDCLLRFYSRQRLMSPEAKCSFVPPDVQPLDLQGKRSGDRP